MNKQQIKQIRSDSGKIMINAHNLLRYNFLLDVSMGERMLLRKKVHQSIENLCRTSIIGSFNPGDDAVVNHIINFYGFSDLNKLCTIAAGNLDYRVSLQLNNMMRHYR